MVRLGCLLIITLIFGALISKAQLPKLIVPTGHVLSISDVDFSRDGKYMVTVADNEIKYWETETGKLIYNLKGNRYEGFTNNGQSLIAVELKNDTTGKIKFYDLKTGNLTDSVTGSTIKYNKDKSLMLLSSGADSINLIDVKTKKIRLRLPKGFGFFINDDKQIFTADILKDDVSYHIMIWDATTKKLISEHIAGLAGVRKNLIVLEQDSTIKILDLNKNEFVQIYSRPKRKNSEGYHSFKMRFSPDLKLAMFFTDEKKLIVIDNETHELKKTIDFSTAVEDVVFNEDGSTFIVIDQDSSATAYHTQTLTPKYELKGHHKWINKLVFSADNKFILTSSFDKTAILWNAQDGSFVRTFTGKNSTIETGMLSENGKYLAQHINGNTFIWETATAKKMATIKCNSDDVRFSSDYKYIIINQNIASSTTSKQTAIYELLGGKLIHAFPSEKYGGTLYYVSSSAQKIAAVNEEQTHLKVIDLNQTELFSILPTKNLRINAASFSVDEQLLFVSCSDTAQNSPSQLFAYNLAEKKEVWTYKAKRIYDDFKVTADDKFLIVRTDADSISCITLKTGQPVSLPYKAEQWGIREINSTANGKYLWINGLHELLVYNLNTRKKLIELNNDEGISMVQVSHDGILTYGDYSNKLYSYELETAKLIKIVETRGYPASLSNGLLLTCDRTFVHLHKDSKLLYSLLAVEIEDQVVIDQFGRYDGTEMARKLLYFTCGTEIISLEQVKDILWVPNLVERISRGETINSPKLSDLSICGLTPLIETIKDKTDDYHFKIIPRNGGLGETVLYINDIEVKRFLPTQLTKVGLNYELKITKSSLMPYFASGKNNIVNIKAYTAKNDIASRGVKVSNQKTSTSAIAPNLYAVIVGVSDYKGTELDLKYAAKDASDIASALGFSARKLLNIDGKEHVFIYNLNTSKDAIFPEKLSIKNTIAAIGKKANANDIFLVFFAGHGVMEGAKKQFYFLTADASKESNAAVVGISTDELSEWMKPANIKAQKRILIFDACNSGQAVNELVKIGGANQQYLTARNDDQSQQIKTIEKLNEKSGLFILSASASNQSAYEMGKYSQGLLTYALLKAIKEQPDILDDNKFLNVGKWFSAAEKTVTDLVRESGNRQEPQVVSTSNFNIGIVDQEVMSKIILPQEKILFSLSNFQNSDETIADDDLELSKAINLALSQISSRGNTSTISYVAITNSPDAHALSGRYEVKGEDIIVRVNIRKNKDIKYRFEITGQKTNLIDLSEAIVKKAAELAK